MRWLAIILSIILLVPAEARPRDPITAFFKAFQPVVKKRHTTKFHRVAVQNRSVDKVSIKPDAAQPAPIFVDEKYTTGALPDIVTNYAMIFNLDPRVARALIRVESDYNINETGSAGEIGLGQIKCQTAREIGFTGSCRALYGVALNLHYSMKYLSEAKRLSDGTRCGMLSRYNAGIYSSGRVPAYCRRVEAAMQLEQLSAK